MIYDETALENGVIFLHAYDILNETMNQSITRNRSEGTEGMALLDEALFVPVVVNGSFNSNIFAEWRYFHEGNSQSANLDFISHFMKTVFSVAVDE